MSHFVILYVRLGQVRNVSEIDELELDFNYRNSINNFLELSGFGVVQTFVMHTG